MATTKRRLNITLAPDVEKMITRIAKRDRMPEATKVVQLVEQALEIEEDTIWEQIAEERFKSAKKWLTHDQVWKK